VAKKEEKKIIFCSNIILFLSLISFNTKNIVRMIQSFYSVELHSRFQSPKLPYFIFGGKIEDSSGPGVHQSHGTHATGFPAEVDIVACQQVTVFIQVSRRNIVT
jgi:hypothetical protein